MKNLLLLSIIIFGVSFFSCNKSETKIEREVAIIETSYGNIIIDLFEKVAPNHCANFKKLASEKFYDGLYFHRVIPGFMVQGGDPNTRDDDKSNDGMGKPDQPTVLAEFNKISHKRGIVSMARKDDINSASSQFFIIVADSPYLDGQYTVFGKVIEGMNVVDKIVNVPRDQRDNPNTSVFMNKVSFEKRMILPSIENNEENKR